ncbi:adenylate/guanylate cyclase domain-containing protein [Robiginitalea sp.]|uniref:adenylate/guanylate cyclase domain-containing protein n=1 Tax=Robiginitalea sp. TaxID=1902411 RepID=UPI003C6A02AB
MKQSLITVILVLLTWVTLNAQAQSIADSLKLIYASDTLNDAGRLKVLNGLAFNESNDMPLALSYAEEMIHLSSKLDSLGWLGNAYLQKGYILLELGDLDAAAETFYLSAEAAKKNGEKLEEGAAMVALADTYAEAGEHHRSEQSYLNSIALLRHPEVQDRIQGVRQLAVALFNLGDLYLTVREPAKAQKCLREAGSLFDKAGDKTASFSVIGNMGRSYAGLGDYQKAEAHLLRAIDLLTEVEYFGHVSAYQESLAELYLQTGDYQKGHQVALKSLNTGRKLGDKPQISKSSKILARLDSITGNYQEAYEHLNLHMAYKDSMDLATVDMTRLEREKAELQVQKQESELQLQAVQQKRQQLTIWVVGITALLLTVIAFGSYRRYRFIKNTNQIISEERDRSDNLLQNILPKQTAMELKKLGRVRAQRFDEVSVLFTDFKGFTSHAESLDPEKLVESIDYYFSHFDTIMDKYGLEKIKTVGDAYMCASGLPYPSDDHAQRIVEAALEILEFVEAAKKVDSEDHVRFDVRIGINSGAVVAGVVGTKKFAYDIWGDTVNIASRMESASEEGKINIAENTFELVKNDFDCLFRGNMEVKNRGKLNMYYVLGKKFKAQSA